MKWLLVVLLMAPQADYGQVNRAKAEGWVQQSAHHYGVSAELVAAVIDVESRWNPKAVSSRGAVGLMQLMPATARRYGAFQPFDTEQNIAAGTRYLTTLMWEFHGDLRLVAAAYYAGDRWVGKRQLDYNNSDVIAYVESVRRHYTGRTRGRTSSYVLHLALAPWPRRWSATTRTPRSPKGICCAKESRRT
jgi:soluble lytic murein transglycosylase-like protein